MLATDRDALFCDLAETYGIFDMEALPVHTLAVLSCGLRDNSRIKMIMSGLSVSTETFLLAGCFDMLAWLRWSKTEDAANGGEPPGTILEKLLGMETEPETVGFASAEEYQAARERILAGVQYGN